MHAPYHLSSLAIGMWLVVAASNDSVVAERHEIGILEYVSAVSRDSLHGVACVEVSDDGKFLYAAAWRGSAINVFERHPKTGKLSHLQELLNQDSNYLDGCVAVRLSPDGRHAVSAAFRSRTVVLYERQPDGTLRRLHVAKHGIQVAVDAAFSADSKFVYVIDSGTGIVTTFEISEDQTLRFVEANAGWEDCFANVRGIVSHPNGKSLVTTSSDAGSLVLLNRSAESGTTTVRQIIKDGMGDVHGLDGAMSVAVSPDGRFVYTSAGRFRGDHAIGVYRFDDEGMLRIVQEVINGEGELTNFKGGNEIAVSPDGLNVYAVASVSSSIACFARDPSTGKLRFLETIADEDGRTTMGAGIDLSPDGQFAYVAAEGSKRISVFRRRTAREE